MRPHLRLISGTLPSDPSYGRGSARVLGRGLYAVPLVRLSYQYGPITLPRSLKPLPRITVQDGTLYEVERDRAAEARVLAELTALGFGSVHEVVPVYYQHAHTDDFVAARAWVESDLAADRDAGSASAAARRLERRHR